MSVYMTRSEAGDVPECGEATDDAWDGTVQLIAAEVKIPVKS